ncbi:MAG: PP2C family protein-serine/threonine phosphatase [Candidatus Korobacteraceae bacterium]
MPWPARIASLFRSTRRPSPNYWMTVPIHRLTYLLLAIFCMFGMVGCFVDLLALGQHPLPFVMVWTIFSGAIAAAGIFTAFRAPRRIWIVAVAWFAGSRLLSEAMRHFPLEITHPSVEHGVRTATVTCIILSIGAYVFFMLFIQNEGRHAIRIQTELAIAQSIQQTLVPVVDWRSERIEIYGISLPSAEVGGDLVDVVPLPDGSVFAYVADVSGHGLPAGILMGMIKTAVRTQLFDLPSPTAVFERLNEVLPAVKEAHMYATCTALRIHASDKDSVCRLDFAIAGQPAMLHASSAAGTVSRLEDQQLPLGLLAGPPYQGQSLALQPGDVLLVATDGILEATNKSGNEFGLEQLGAVLGENRSQPLAALAEKIHQALSASYAQDDDQSLLLVRLTS